VFDRKHTCVVVVGAQWGDEGKGKLVDVLAERADLVVRYQGGANAGHTVVVGDQQFVLHQIPSGILHAGATCVVGNGVVLDPDTFFHELDQLGEKGIDIAGRLFVSERAHLVMPYHKLLDQASEKQQQIGTTGRGIGPTYEDKIGRRGIRVADLCTGDGGRELLARRIERANEMLALMGAEQRADLAEHVELADRVGARLRPLATDTGLLTWKPIRS
jgi:adenylosuccinate synthase